jgi:hypothetical protein
LGFLIRYTIRVNTLTSAKRSVRAEKLFPCIYVPTFGKTKNGPTQATSAAAAEKQQKIPYKLAWNYT